MNQRCERFLDLWHRENLSWMRGEVGAARGLEDLMAELGNDLVESEWAWISERISRCMHTLLQVNTKHEWAGGRYFSPWRHVGH